MQSKHLAALLGPDCNPVSNGASKQLIRWIFICSIHSLLGKKDVSGISLNQILALTCMDALMPWAHGCAGTVQITTNPLRNGVRESC